MSGNRVEEFLKKYKSLACVKDSFFIVPRDKNIQCIADLGITTPQAKDVIMNLNKNNYYKGPEEDKNGSGNNVWIFQAIVRGKCVYIKLSDDFQNNKAKCISFHSPQYSMKKKKKKKK